MPSDITLTSALQNNLQSLQKSKGSNTAATVHENATVDGNVSASAVQDTIFSAAQDLCTQSLSSRASELTQLLENLSQSIKTLEKANQGVEELGKIIKDAENLALEVQKSPDNDAAAAHKQKLATIKDQMRSVVNNAKIAGVNLLAGDTLKTAFGNNERNTVVTEGVDLSPEKMGFEEISFDSPSSIDKSIEIIRSAMDETQSLRLTIAGDLKNIQTRQDFTQETIGTLEAGKSEINITALNEEGANLLALQTRMTLEATSLPLAASTQEGVLRLF